MKDKKMTCPDCNSPNYIKYIDLTISCPANVDEVTKSVIKKKEVNIVGIDWENVRYFCPDCFDRIGLPDKINFRTCGTATPSPNDFVDMKGVQNNDL